MSARETLYALLPAVYRRRDAERGEPLRALLAVIDAQLQVVQADVETTWDNWFVETAEEWLVPYIGEALGLPVTRNVEAIAFSRRAYVANAIQYRRSKGTAAMLERLARDLTNYPARVVEFFTRAAWTEALNHQAERPATLDLRSTVALERLGGPFDTAARTIDVRRIASGRGTHNLPNVGLFLWRTQLWPIVAADAAAMSLPGQSAWRFDPLGGDRALHAALVTETDPAVVATEASVPLALSRRRLWAQARQLGPAMTWPFSIAVHGDDAGGARVVRPVAADRIDVCDLSAIDTVPAGPAADRVVVDPQLGRLALGAGLIAGLGNVEVVTDHHAAVAGDLGAGPWDRGDAARAWLAGWTDPPEGRTVGFQVSVAREGAGADVVATLDAAIDRWNAFLAGLADDAARGRALGLILVSDSRTHAAPTRVVALPTGAVLGIVAASWPTSPDPAGGPGPVRLPGRFVADAVRPIVRGDVTIRGDATTATNRGELRIDGLVVTGRVAVGAGALQGLRLASASVRGPGGVVVDTAGGANADLELSLSRAIVSGVAAPGALGRVWLADSAVTGALDLPASPVDAVGCTVLGPTRAERLDATSCVFDDVVAIEQHQVGCVRFSYVPVGSRTPARFRCQPDLALADATGAAAQAAVRARVRPRFVTLDPDAPGALLLDPDCVPEIRGAAEDGGEPGCWNHLQHGLRVANLRNALPQFLRFGLESGIFFLV